MENSYSTSTVCPVEAVCTYAKVSLAYIVTAEAQGLLFWSRSFLDLICRPQFLHVEGKTNLVNSLFHF